MCGLQGCGLVLSASSGRSACKHIAHAIWNGAKDHLDQCSYVADNWVVCGLWSALIHISEEDPKLNIMGFGTSSTLPNNQVTATEVEPSVRCRAVTGQANQYRVYSTSCTIAFTL
jgi:hypothetical protein